MTCSVRHNVKETLVGENLVRMEGNELIPVVSEDKLLSRAYTMAQQLLEEYGTEAADLPFMVSEDRVILNDELFRMIDGADPETQSSMENELLMSMRHLMRQLGISENVVSVLKDREGNPIQGVAAADLINRSIQYLEGKESELPEEVIHFYVQALKDTSDPLYLSMRDRVASEPEYAEVTRDYQDLGYTQEDIIDEAIAKVILNRVRPQVKTGVSELFESNPELANSVYEALGFNNLRKEYSNVIIDQVWKRLANEGITNADSLIGTRETINNKDFNKFWSAVKDVDIQNVINFFKAEKQKALDSFSKYQGEFDPTTGTFTSNDTSFFDKKIKELNTLLQQKQQAQQLYSQYLDTKNRLYRSETSLRADETKAPDWLKEQPEIIAQQEAQGRWFYKSLEEAQEHLKKFEGDKITYIDVIEDVEQYNAKDNKFAGGYGREGREYFVSKELAKSRAELGSKQDLEGFKAFVSKGKSEDTGDRNTRWWNRVLKRLREMFGVGTEKTDPFKQAALEMFRRDLTQYRDVVSSFTRGTILRSVGDTQALIRDSILAQHNKLKQEPIDWKELVGKLDTLLIEQAKEGDGVILRYRTDDGKIITKRATDGHQIEFLRTLKKNRKKSDPKKYEHIRVTGTQLHDSARWIAVKYAEKHSDKFNLPKVTDDKTPGTKELIEKSGLTQEQFKHFAEEVVKIMDDMYRLQQTIDPKGKVDVMPEVTVLDEKSDTAGTIDLLFLFSDGSAAVYDYKFISPGTDALRKVQEPNTYLLSKDQFYNKKLEGYENQMGFYLNALNRQYGIPPNKIRRSRLVPGHVRFEFSKGKPEKIMYFAMGASKDRYLQQIPVRQEYSAELPKKLLDKLSEIYARLNVLDSVEKKNASQRKETELLNTAVRELLNDSDMRWTLEEIDNALENFRELRKEDKLEEMTSEQIAQDILMLSRYKMVNEAMEYRTLSEASKSKLQNLNAEVESAMMVLDTLFKDRVLKEKGYDLTIASKKSGGVDKLLSLHTHHNQVVAYGMKLMTEAKIEAQEELNQIMDKFDLADEKLKEWGSKNGKSLQDVYDMFIESSKNGLRLVPVLSNEFRELRQEMTDMMLSDDKTEQLKASKWVKEHFRIKEGAKEQFDKDLERYREVLMNSTPGPKSQRYEDLLKEWLRKRNVWSKESSYAWFLDGKRYLEVTPEKFESSVSQSYKEIMKHPELLEWVTLWKNTMAEMNRRIPHEYIPLSMVPAVPISLGEKVGSDISGMPGYIKEEFKRSFTLETELDERFGEHVKSIPLRYMHAMGSSNGEIDSSMFSRDLRNVMYKFLESALENEKLSQIEGQMLVLRNILASNKVGKMKNGVLDRGPASLENMDPATMEYFDALINSQMYGQKWAQEFTGTLFGVKISAKSVQSMMSLFSKIRMTVPVRAALAAGVAGEGFLRAQMNSNPNFGEKNYQKSLTMLLKDNDRFWALARRFDAISEAQSALVAREKRSLLTSRALDPVYGYYPLIPVDRMLNATAMVTMLHNYAMVNGEAVRLSLLPEGTKSIAEGVEIKDGKLVTEIPLEILKKLIMVHRMEMRGVTGSMSQYDFAAYHNDMMVSVLMQFKGWMPGLAQAHFGGVRYDQLLDRFDEGKIAGSLKAVSSKFNRDEMEGELKLRDLLKKTADTVLDGLHTLVRDSAYTLSSVERDKRIKEGTWDLNSTAEKKYQNRRNRLLAEFEIFRNNTSVPRFRKEGKATESDIEAFMQMRQQSVRGMMTELRNMLGTMLLSSILTAALMGDDDEATYASKVSNDLLARIILEMAQFYNPIELMKTVKNPIALLGLAELIAKIGSNGVDEMLTLVGVRDGKRDMTPFLHFSRKLLPGFNTYSFFSGD